MYENDSDNDDDLFKIDDSPATTLAKSPTDEHKSNKEETKPHHETVTEKSVETEKTDNDDKAREAEFAEQARSGKSEDASANNANDGQQAQDSDNQCKQKPEDHYQTFEFDAGKVDEERVANMTEYEPQGIVEDSQMLLQAAKSKNIALVKQILHRCPKLKVDLQDEVGKTALHHLSSTDSAEEIRMCITKGGDINMTDTIGWTPLHYASLRGQKDVVEVLVGMGANCNIPEKQSERTPLHVAVSRSHRDVVNLLLLSGADPTKKDKDGKSVQDVSKSVGMSDLIEDAVDTFETQDSRDTEKMQIEPNRVTPFLSLGVTVKHVVEGGISQQRQPFSLRLRRSNDTNNSTKYNLQDSEDLCSDEFIIKLRGARNEKEIHVELGIDLIYGPSPKEELVFKTDATQEILIANIKEVKNKYRGTILVDILSFTSFVVVSRPKLEKFEVGDGASTLKSAVDDRVELAIEAGTFGKKVTISMEITEPPPQDELKDVLAECADLSSTSAFYSLEAGDTGFSKPIAVKIPLPQNYTGNGNLLILSMDKPPDEEKPEHWKPLDAEAKIIDGRIEFTVSSFSVKVATETIRPFSRQSSVDSMSSFGSQASLLSQVSKVFRKSRRKEFKVKVFSVTRRQGTSNSFRLITECCKEDQIETRIAYWEGEGFNLQGSFQELENKPPITVITKQKFVLKPTKLQFPGNEVNTTIEFHQKKESNHAENMVKCLDEVKVTKASMSVYMIHKGTKTEDGVGEDTEENVAEMEITLYRFHPDMLKELDGKSFLKYNLMIEVQEELGDSWWKVLLLLDIPFTKLEQTMLGGGRDIKDKINGLLFDWRESKRGEKSRGVPDLLSALARSSRAGVVHKLRKHLVRWKSDEQNKADGFYEWLENAYKFNMLLPTKRTKPMTDQFLAMVADMVKPTEELVECLGIEKTTGMNILRNDRTYSTSGLKTMKILTTLRSTIVGTKMQMTKLLDGLKKQQLTEPRDYAIMWTKAWIESRSDKQEDKKDEDEFIKLLQEIGA